MVLVIAFLLLASLVVSAGLAAMGGWASQRLPFGEPVMHALNFLVSIGVIGVLFAAIFRFLPDARVAWRDVWVGAGVSAVLFAVGKFAIGLYLGKSTVASVYGAAGSVVVMLIWVYYSAIVLLFGAEMTQATATGRGAKMHARKGFVLNEPRA